MKKTERWTMNRIGFVNFWFYDEEEFYFADGKLLLRGQNGSGKSITTQSFIPFILDGDRTPSRLDPFGSSARRMEYYFLGEEGRDEATGYLYLEFRRRLDGADAGESTEGCFEYRTIGIGQRARRGKPMDFWGFLLLDGKRIGRDVRLAREVGSVRIPLDRRDLRKEIGEGNLLTDSQSEYKKLVNQHIFGFRREEQYDQFIRLLVKVRTPKLSKDEFKPTKVYEILNDSLQTLTDEDLRPMVDAMEKMDGIQESLETLRRAFEGVKVIRTEYTRYNQFMLARKAGAFLDRKKEAEKAEAALADARNRREELARELEHLLAEQESFQAERIRAQDEREGLLDSDLEEMEHKLERAQEDLESAEKGQAQWLEKMEQQKEQIREGELRLQRLQEMLQSERGELKEEIGNLNDEQEVLAWQGHEALSAALSGERTGEFAARQAELDDYGRQIEEGRQLIRAYEEIREKYDEAAEEAEQLLTQLKELEARQAYCEELLEDAKDSWIMEIWTLAERAFVWKPEKALLQEAEKKVRDYSSITAAAGIRELLQRDYEERHLSLLGRKNELFRAKEEQEAVLLLKEEELREAREEKEPGPETAEETLRFREELAEAGIEAVPFYQAVEFADGVAPEEQAGLEAALARAGMLDALVAGEEARARIEKEFPDFVDALFTVRGEGGEPFPFLRPDPGLSGQLLAETVKILCHIHAEDLAEGTGAVLSGDGHFAHGILSGRAKKDEAWFVGAPARKRRREERIRTLEEEVREIREAVLELERQVRETGERTALLEKEYAAVPDFSEIDRNLSALRECTADAGRMRIFCAEKEKKRDSLAAERDSRFQLMVGTCRLLPYGRTEREYSEALDSLRSYEKTFAACRRILQALAHRAETIAAEDGHLEERRQVFDDACVEERRYRRSAEALSAKIGQYREYLSRPEIAGKAKRLLELNARLKELGELLTENAGELAVNRDRAQALEREEPLLVRSYEALAGEENVLAGYFEEELRLKLVFDGEGMAAPESAKKALTFLREADRGREPQELMQALYGVFESRRISLISYGTAIVECFGGEEAVPVPGALRRRVRIVSTWNGKKVYFDEFYSILKEAIEETQMLIQQKDRELFEDILSQTISQQLTDRIAESRRWVEDMSKLMREMDTSMGLRFSLDWKPRSAENEAEIDVTELERILLRDRSLLTPEDIGKVAGHFRSRIRAAKQEVEEQDGVVNYMDLVRDALDYRRWFCFQMYYRHGSEARKALTNMAFNRFSGGEKAMAMYVPLFAAVNAQYQKAENGLHPRIIALDEAFAGVDDRNIRTMFALIGKLDFDYIMNSQSLWGCYDVVPDLKIAELHKPENASAVTVIRYSWNGHERILDEL